MRVVCPAWVVRVGAGGSVRVRHRRHSPSHPRQPEDYEAERQESWRTGLTTSVRTNSCACRWRAARISHVSSYGSLRVGDVVVSRLRNGVENELLAIFRDDMLSSRRVPVREYYGLQGYDESDGVEDDYLMDVLEFRAPGQAIADRLDIFGIDANTILADLDQQFSDRSGITHDQDFQSTLNDEIREQIDEEDAYRLSLGAAGWVQALMSSSEEPQSGDKTRPGSRAWLIEQLYAWDERFALRAVLLAFPQAEVVLDVTDLEEGGYIDASLVGSLASDAVAAIVGMAGMHAPAVVLTEGRTDAEFLKAGLMILYPHLTDAIRFLDYESERRPEGGVSALIRMVRAFAAAGIANRIVAVFDNDAAAMDCLRSLAGAKLPGRIKVIRYPDFELTNSYPTLGPPTIDAPAGSISLANINGLAASIELYLGEDVLRTPDGAMYPVQWKSFLPGIGRYQGEVTHKEQIHAAFRAKYMAASADPATAKTQDWEGLRLILDAIRAAAQSAFDASAASRP
jgi:hypothetical protein